MSPSPLTRTRLLPVAGLAMSALALAACSSANGATGTSGAGSPGSGSEHGPTSTSGGFGGFTAATGKATAVSSSGVKVATSSGTTVVAWATSTRFTRVTTGRSSSIAVGDCITASSGSPRSGTLPAPSPTAPLTATSVTVTSTSACAARSGFGGRGPGGVRPSGAPTPAPGRTPGSGGGGLQRGTGGFGGFGGATGTVTSVSGSRIVLKTLAFGSNAATSRTVITTAKTTYRVSSTATAAAVSAGRCIAAIGSKASDGTLDAQSITVSSPSGGTCPATSLAGGFGGGQSGQPGGGTPPQDGTNA